MSKIRTEISIESNESFVVKRKRYSTRSWCSECERVGIFVLPTEAGFLAGLDVDTIVSLVCAGELHIYKAAGRGTYICLTSLCLLSQSPNQGDENAVYERTKLSSGLEEQDLLIGDLRKL